MTLGRRAGLWKGHVMRPSLWILGLVLWVASTSMHAQYSARQLTRKIVPQQQQQQQPARPSPTPAPAATPTAPVNRVAAPESDRVKQGRDEAARKAVEYQKKRAEEGSAQAQYDLGVRYLKGDGVEKNEALGREWLEKSSKNGFVQADRKLEELPKAAAAAAAGTAKNQAAAKPTPPQPPAPSPAEAAAAAPKPTTPKP